MTPGRQLLALWGDRTGVQAIEFALLAPVLILLVLGSIEAANLYSLRNEMVAASRDAVRRIAVGSIDLAGARQLVQERIRQRTEASIEVLAYEIELADDAGVDVVVEIAVPLNEAMITGLGAFTSSVEREDSGQPAGGVSEGPTADGPTLDGGDDSSNADDGTADDGMTIRVSTTMLKEA